MKRATFKVLFYIKRTKALKNGTVPIYARVTINRQRAEFSIQRSLKENDWDSAKGYAKGYSKAATKINSYIDFVRSELYMHKRKAEELEKLNKSRAKADREKEEKRKADMNERKKQQEKMKRVTRMQKAEQDNETIVTKVQKIDSSVNKVTESHNNGLSTIDDQIEAKRQHALALYKDGNFKEGKAELDSMFTLKQERERLASREQ